MPDWRSHIRPHPARLRLSPTRENEIIDELAQHLDGGAFVRLRRGWLGLLAAGATGVAAEPAGSAASELEARGLRSRTCDGPVGR
jgi:hypothetical protein